MLRIREYFNSTQTLCEILDWICYCAFKVGIDSLTFASIGINTPTCVRISISCNHSMKYLTTCSSVWPTVTGAPKLTYAKLYIFFCTIHNLCKVQYHHCNHHQNHGRDWTRLLQMPPVRFDRAVAHRPYASSTSSPMPRSHALRQIRNGAN